MFVCAAAANKLIVQLERLAEEKGSLTVEEWPFEKEWKREKGRMCPFYLQSQSWYSRQCNWNWNCFYQVSVHFMLYPLTCTLMLFSSTLCFFC